MREDTAFKNAIKIDRIVATEHNAMMGLMKGSWDFYDRQAAANEAVQSAAEASRESFSADIAENNDVEI